MGDISALYPQAPQPQQGQGLLDDPARVIGLINSMQELRSRQAIGSAFQQGDLNNPDAIWKAIQSNPDAARGAPEAYGSILEARGKNIANSTNMLAYNLRQNEAVLNTIGPLVNDPNLTVDKVRNWGVHAATLGVNPQLINSALAGMNEDNVKDVVANINAIAQGPVASAQRIMGVPAATGAPRQTSLGAAGRTPGIAAPTPINVVGLPPGQAEAAAASGVASAGMGTELGKAADSSPIRKGMLGNLEADLKQFKSGAGADWQGVAKNWANRNVLPTALQFDPKSIASQEAFNKQAEQLAQQQFSAIGGTGTDAKFGSAFKSNPNQALSQLGNKGIIRLLKGNEDAIQSKNQAWQDWLSKGNSSASYPAFAREFNSNFDPRVYQAQYMSKDELANMMKGMSAQEQRQFIARKNHAVENGHSAAPGGYYAGE